jgi:hypothetical protein
MSGFINEHARGDCRDRLVAGQVEQPSRPIAHSHQVAFVREQPEIHRRAICGSGVVMETRPREKL